MTAQKSWRQKLTSTLATATVALVTASGMALAPTAAFADVAAPTLTVAHNSNITAGTDVMVTGTGYNPAQGIYVTSCTDTALADVDFDFINAGCTDGANLVWPHGAVDSKGAPRALQFSADGSFSLSMPIVERAGSTAMYTIANHTAMADRSQDAKAPVRFAAPVELTATVADAKADALSVAIAANKIQLLPGDLGVYAALIVKGTESELGQASMGATADFYPTSQIVNGAIAKTLPAAKKASLDRTKQYEVVVWRAHGNATPDRIVARTDVAITAAQWDAVFPKPTPEIPFTDVKQGDKFYNEISWMYTSNLSTGVKVGNTVQYMPKANVTREAMAAFLYRLNAPANYKAPKTSKFSDVKPGDKFYKEIAWMGEKGYSTGVKQADGTRAYAPKASITREAMAAFMYRIDDTKKPSTPQSSPFIDVKQGDKFYKEIAWMSESGLSTGINQSNGTKAYAPKSNVTREAMAAFLFRAEAK